MHYASSVELATTVGATEASGFAAGSGDVAKPIEHDDEYSVKLFSIDITDNQKHGKSRKKLRRVPL